MTMMFLYPNDRYRKSGDLHPVADIEAWQGAFCIHKNRLHTSYMID